MMVVRVEQREIRDSQERERGRESTNEESTTELGTVEIVPFIASRYLRRYRITGGEDLRHRLKKIHLLTRPAVLAGDTDRGKLRVIIFKRAARNYRMINRCSETT